MILADTSVFIDFFKGKDSAVFDLALERGKVLLSDFVRLELLQGIRKNEWPRLRFTFQGLEPMPPVPELVDEAEAILRSVKARGLTIGSIDVLIAAQARLADVPILSNDAVFKKLAALRLIKIAKA